MELRRTSCCGVRDFHGLTEYNIDSVPRVFLDMFPTWDQINGAYVMFTMPTNTTMLDALSAFITQNELGTPHLMGPNYNPQSRRQLWVLMWQVNKENYERWGRAERRRIEEERIREQEERRQREVAEAEAREADKQNRIALAIARTDDRLLRRGSRIVVVNAQDINNIGLNGVVTDFGPRDVLRRVHIRLQDGRDYQVERAWVRREANT